MLDTDTFLTTLYVMVDDFCNSQPPPETQPGPPPSLTASEVVTLAIFGQWQRFASERDFYRYARRHLRPAFPTLPDRTQLNRLLRRQRATVVAFFLHLVARLQAQPALYEALDCSAVPTREVKRRGAGWLPGLTDIGWSNRLGWFEGFRLLMSVNPQGVVTGFGFAAASTKDQPLAETFFALRQQPHPALPSVGRAATGCYVVDTGFEGQAAHARWHRCYGVRVVCRPKRTSRHPWPKPWRRWLASIRQMVETVYDKLHHTFRLCRERPHELSGFQARLAAKMALHNFCLWLNVQLGRAPLAFADLLDW
ncbi:MAG: transposase [Caldilineaceae bacterium]|nr:transposase [Caldilineaceae bacterium]